MLVTKDYKQTKLKTLRLPVDFLKLRWDDDVILAYNVLCTKGKKKAAYTTKAILHYEKTVRYNSSLRTAMTHISKIKKLAEKYSITTCEELDNLIISTDIKNLSSTMPCFLTPHKMLLGFNSSNEDSIRIFNQLFCMPCTERALYIAKAIRTYVEDGCDPKWYDYLIDQFLCDVATEFNRGDEISIIDNLHALFRNCIAINAPTPTTNLSYLTISSKLTDELAALLY